jgi:hypothetical protein
MQNRQIRIPGRLSDPFIQAFYGLPVKKGLT